MHTAHDIREVLSGHALFHAPAQGVTDAGIRRVRMLTRLLNFALHPLRVVVANDPFPCLLEKQEPLKLGNSFVKL